VRILITGVSGFVGPHLVRHLAETEPGNEIWGLVWPGDRAEPPDSIRPVDGDLKDPSSLEKAFDAARPDIVFHLAAASSVEGSWKDAGRFLEVNAIGTVHLLEAARAHGGTTRVVVASTGEIYGAVPAQQQPITEHALLSPVSPYAASKAAQDLITAQYFAGHGLDTVRLRLFNHTGPGRPPQFAASSFARQLARIERGLDPPRLTVGNLEAIRDFTDVRDVVRAYWLAATDCISGGAYNVCSGRGTSIRRVLEVLVAHSGVEVEIEEDPDRLRTADIPRLVGDTTRFTDLTGWRPEIPLDQTLADLLDWWRSEVSNQ
jgi:GDP-4-dehydro-6-deoxy-D-mannose reductase